MKKLIKKLLGKTFSPSSPLYEAYHKTRGIAAAALTGFPSRKMVVIGVTGTNGKTTTCNLLAGILEEAGEKVGLATTVNFWLGEKRWVNETKMTTFSPFQLQKLLRQMASAKCRYAILETSSHALAQHRVIGVDYDLAVFTNLTPEHLDFHLTFENYRDAKLKLFQKLFLSRRKTDTPKVAIINSDDPSAQFFTQIAADKTYLYSINEFLGTTTTSSTVSAKVIREDEAGTVFKASTPLGNTTIHLRLPGNFNIQNALAAISAALALGITLEDIKKGLEKITAIPGRMERIDAKQPFTVIVDYAHTPDGFTKALSTARSFTKGKLISVFGSAGDRDKLKRPLLGEVASKYCDTIILTEEDPGSENPLDIIKSIKKGIPPNFRENVNIFTIPNRKDALSRAFQIAKPRDTVMLLAMGAQTKMATKKGLVPYNERQFAQNLLESIVRHTT